MTFIKNNIPWNKGKKGIHLNPKTEFKKGQHPSKKTEFKKGHKIRWKGDNAGYVSKHDWVVKILGKPNRCEHCKKCNLYGRKIHWASKDHKYSRNVDEYIRLCAKCHYIYDKKNNLRK